MFRVRSRRGFAGGLESGGVPAALSQRASPCRSSRSRGPAGTGRFGAGRFRRPLCARRFWRIPGCAAPARSRITPPAPRWKPWPACRPNRTRREGRPPLLPAIRLRAILLPVLRGSAGRSGHGQPAGVSGDGVCRAGQPRGGAARQRAAGGNAHRGSRLFLQGLALAADWLCGPRGRLSCCRREETNWLRADALWHLEHAAIISGGAGVVGLTRDPALSIGVELAAVTGAHTFSARQSRRQAARAMRADFSRRRDFLMVAKFVSIPPEPAVVHEEHPQRFASRSTGLLRLLLGADERERTCRRARSCAPPRRRP